MLNRIFCTNDFFGDHDTPCQRLLARELHLGNVVVTEVTIATAPVTSWHKRFSGGADHQRLCERAARWLAAQGFRWVDDPPRCTYPGGCADVAQWCALRHDRNYAQRDRVFVECGYTQVFKVLMAMRVHLQLLVVPYHDTHGYIFSPTARLQFDLEDAANPASTVIPDEIG